MYTNRYTNTPLDRLVLPAIIVCLCLILSATGRHLIELSPSRSSVVLERSMLMGGLAEKKALDSGLVDSGLVDSGLVDSGGNKLRVRRQAVANRTRTWPRGVVPYVIDKAFTPEVQAQITTAMRVIEDSVGNKVQPCVQFVPRTSEINYLDIHFGTGCSSVIGLDFTGPQVSTYSIACAAKGSAIHELLHTLGMYHEQDRYDRDDYLSINFTNMREDAYRDFVKKNRTDLDTLGTPYDFSSIMQYGPYSFGKDLRYPVMTPKPELAKNVWMGQRGGPSKMDVLRIQRLYQCEEDTSHVISDFTTESVLAWCDFGDDVCNMSVVVNDTGIHGTDDVAGGDDGVGESIVGQVGRQIWTVTSKATPDGPVAGSTNGLDNFFYASKEYSWLVAMETSDKTSFPEYDVDGLADSSPTSALSDVDGFEFDGTTRFSLTSESSEVDGSTMSPQASSSSNVDGSTRPYPASSSAPDTQQQNETTASVTLLTHLMTTNSPTVCIYFRVYQSGSTSYLQVFISGPAVPQTTVYQLKDVRTSKWQTIQLTLELPAGIEFLFELTMQLGLGSVAIDDFHVLKGDCPQ